MTQINLAAVKRAQERDQRTRETDAARLLAAELGLDIDELREKARLKREAEEQAAREAEVERARLAQEKTHEIEREWLYAGLKSGQIVGIMDEKPTKALVCRSGTFNQQDMNTLAHQAKVSQKALIGFHGVNGAPKARMATEIPNLTIRCTCGKDHQVRLFIGAKPPGGE